MVTCPVVPVVALILVTTVPSGTVVVDEVVLGVAETVTELALSAVSAVNQKK
jgi:hypothetical protein